MTEVEQDFRQSQASACRSLLLGCTCLWPLILLASVLIGGSLWAAPLVSAGFLAIGWASRGARPETARLGASAAAIGQAIAATTAFAGHPWQIDMHMTFFAALAALVLLVDQRAILAATGLIVVHHLSASVLMPALVYPSSDVWQNIARTLLHGAIVGAEAGALLVAVRVRLHNLAQAKERETGLRLAKQAAADLLDGAEAARQMAEDQRQAADGLRRLAEAAQQETAAESARALAAQQAADALRTADEQRRTAAMADQQLVVSNLRTALTRLAGGDMTVSIDTGFPAEYESLRCDFNGAVARLCDAMAQVSLATARIRHEATALGLAAGNLAIRTERQAATVEETSAALSEFSIAVQKSAQIATDAEGCTARAKAEALGGASVVDQATEAMQRIADSSQRIARINSVIGEVAFQTNLLALNAGVEAARAGEAGRGFAVVASEVRALSQRCSEAAKEISALVQQSGQQVREGVDLVAKTGQVLGIITQSVTTAADRVAAIARTAAVQGQTLTEIVTAVGDLDSVTQQNATMFDQTSAACTALDEATAGMSDLMGHFVTTAGPTAESGEAPTDFRSRRRA